jgi:hypothetical protein
MVTVVEARAENFEPICDYLRREGSPKITRAMWRGLLDQRWQAPERHFGHALMAEGKVVGFLGYLFSVQVIDGKERRFCNVSTFVVDPEHRNQSLRLVAPLAALRDHTLVNVTPSPDAYKIFKALGWKHLETGITALLPVVDPLRVALARGAKVVFDEREIARRLSGDAARVFADHRGLPVAHMLLETPAAQSYVLATRRSYRNVPFAHVQYVSDPELLARASDAARLALMAKLRAPLVLIDRRLQRGARFPRAMARAYPSPLLYRSRELAPSRISNAYTELTVFPV